MYQFASVTRWGRNTGTTGLSTTDLPVLPATVRPVRAAAAGIGEGVALVTLDVAVVVLVSLAAGSFWVVALARAVLLTGVLAMAGLHRSRLRFSVLDDLPRIAGAVGVVLAGGLLLASPLGPLPRTVCLMPFLWAGALLVAMILGRALGYRLLRRHRRTHPGRATIVVGCGDVAVRLADALREDRTYGLTPVGLIGPHALTSASVPVLAPATELERAVARYKPQHLIVAFPATADSDLVPTLRRCRRYGVTIHVVPRLFELSVGTHGAELIRGIPVSRLRPDPAQTRRWAIKRTIDIVGSLLGLILLSPVLLACAALVLIESRKHGVLFKQERITTGGSPFTILKFRSLTPSSDLESQVKWNINTDARLSPIGKLLRFSSLDELPQLVNVLRGDMSLVGPRPERPYFVQQFERTYEGYPDRHRVPAGITGWAQIHGLRGDTSIEERVRFDNHYIENWSLGMDLKIIVRTALSMVSIHRD